MEIDKTSESKNKQNTHTSKKEPQTQPTQNPIYNKNYPGLINQDTDLINIRYLANKLSNKFHLVLSITKQNLKQQVGTLSCLTSSISPSGFLFIFFKCFLSKQVYN